MNTSEYARVKELLGESRIDETIDYMVTIKEKDEVYYFLEGCVYHYYKINYDQAKQSYLKSISIDNKLTGTWTNLIQLMHNLNNYDSVIKYCYDFFNLGYASEDSFEYFKFALISKYQDVDIIVKELERYKIDKNRIGLLIASELLMETTNYKKASDMLKVFIKENKNEELLFVARLDLFYSLYYYIDSNLVNEPNRVTYLIDETYDLGRNILKNHVIENKEFHKYMMFLESYIKVFNSSSIGIQMYDIAMKEPKISKEKFIEYLNNLSEKEILNYASKGGDLNFTLDGQNNVSPISFLIQKNRIELAKKLTSYGASLDYGLPLLELTTLDDYTLEDVKYFVENGANVNEIGVKDFFPLWNVAFDNRLDIAKYLYSRGGNLH